MKKRALISVSDKTGIQDFAAELAKLGIEIISTGGTAKALTDAGIDVINVSDVTGFAECLDGRVKTLHPTIHAGILNMRQNPKHQEEMNSLGYSNIDFVIVNLYPFKETILKADTTLAEAIENIDIGGPTMLRSAAKNSLDVVVIIDPQDYQLVLDQLIADNQVSNETKCYLGAKVFEHTANYDAMISRYLREQSGQHNLPDKLTLTFEKVQDMRYGENPHQAAGFYKEIGYTKGTLSEAVQLNGKELSYNNINDANGALQLLKEFKEPTVVAVKHASPCGVATAHNVFEAYNKAFLADPISIFGGIVVTNGEITKETAQEMVKIFLEIVIAPSFTDEALNVLKTKPNLRILQLDNILYQNPNGLDMKKVDGGLIIQHANLSLYNEDEIRVVTDASPTDEQWENLKFAWKIVKHVKSNGIALVKNNTSLGLGGGQVNRIWATKQAIEHGVEILGSVEGSVLASDAFFPFSDCVEEAIKAGVKAIIQPGGSVRDQESIDVCNQHNIPMVFTHMRHFKH
ncbi:MAG: bifunctional phosphoribosylaminoimidazolecarboxamide formyltransferase/inosine monophosphate cyclohydrolase [Epulopiscium sp. Nele67-Bin002]|nr:MAG: bifunctional phosphoribosylaminoimidazolecarboxamide formyltransferase/inosine monophosphate cyclohydrolase [Epulopiscium sp. Nele67-Bin002]